MSSIAPTIGRKVWFFEAAEGLAEKLFNIGPLDPKQAYDATVVFVQPDGSVSLDVTSHHGLRAFIKNCELRDPGDADAHGSGVAYATWMPYQKNQALAAAAATAGQPPAALASRSGTDTAGTVTGTSANTEGQPVQETAVQEGATAEPAATTSDVAAQTATSGPQP